MDPQACLARIIEIVQRGGLQDEDLAELEAAFGDLAEWLRRGGFRPVATGPIFGDTDVAVRYPGMLPGSPAKYERRPIRHVKSRPSAWRYAIMAADPDCRQWVFVEYVRDDARQQWLLPTA